ncbi:D-alanyl-lipoteichoic acid acyltransferase DltB, MBOAT superfamily [Oribacterium sp. KHPX15]|uniref:MBOAT family O-acyltransferase n=1 Tax=Oribacterium sp. KHPX15 TaxID=1855342 RepID=UPI00089D58A3|nr:MBOAT family O-acyltransferase [Oribacterium sp. KHPX15]SEA39771.1 D-alanyl-lipoteichoic acid acyltransferase DltB, MBOAT superfamily [Oribacterium sp. KHPX15]
MVFNSLGFLVFFPIVLIIYYIVPKGVQNFWLLLSSYWFYMSWNPRYGLLLLIFTIFTYICGLVLGKDSGAARANPGEIGVTEVGHGMKGVNSKRKRILAFSLFVVFGLLAFFKYTNFLLDNVSGLLARLSVNLSVNHLSIVMPVGISFFLFQSAGYLIDVYRKEIPAEKNFINYALFVSFFPSILSGPIGRAPALLPQYLKPRSFDWDSVSEGFLLMLWGFFLKLVIADRAAILVNNVYAGYHNIYGSAIVAATVIYGIEIYCDFCGYSTIATGAAKMLGVRLMDNFNCPYFSVSVQDFWRRWHISLSSWFRDYLYFPLGGSRCNIFRRYFNIMVVFIVSGLWHGSQWSYIVWGALNGIYQIIGSLLLPIRIKVLGLFGFDKDVLDPNKNPAFIDFKMTLLKLIRILITFCLIDFAWLFFRAAGLRDAVMMLQQIRCNFGASQFSLQYLYSLGLDMKNFLLLIFATVILFIGDFVKYRGGSVGKWVLQRPMILRELIIALFILFILIFGIWGNAYNASSFIYFQY